MNDARIQEMLDKRFRELVLESLKPSWLPFGKSAGPTAFSKRGLGKFLSKWRAHIRGIQMKIMTQKGMERVTRRPPHRHSSFVVLDPAFEWRGCRPAVTYIEIPYEVALKILALEHLP